ncbi:acetoin utilization protein AcuC [Nesterenkonia lutea]|uniref:Acetoin utilization protein AcuC n=1 Tax=Nesterenkonia lutea TaxID=272919 RepID=A0ABR9JHP8_9MICC|nr:acetoin utilization protein AcuC [Nesterenkonia lutea]
MAALPAVVVWDEALLAYRFSSSHPMDPVRLELTARLCEEFGLFTAAHVRRLETQVASDEVLGTVHTAEYIAAVKAAAEHGRPSLEHGLGTEDTPVFSELHLGAARIADGTHQCAQALLSGTAVRAVNFAGGMHHSARAHAGGFCVYNDSAVAIQHLLDQGTRRVVYIDVDAHHGDGTQSIFYEDPRVMTISIHQTGVALYPGTGFPNEIGGPGAEGTAVNIAVPEGTGDAGWLRAFHAVVPQLVQAFEPEVILSQHGCDSHREDPLSDLQLSVDAHRQTALDVAHLADEHCEGRWIATGGGGYSVHTVVPRSWTHLSAVALGMPIPLHTPVPQRWRDHVLDRYQISAPESMGDDAQLWWRSWELGYDPSDAVDRAVMQTRKEIFPLHGLDPWFD